MEQAGEEIASRRGALANKWAADAHALALLPTIRTLMAAGFVSQRELANELNRRGIATARGGNWHRNTVLRMLRRLDLLTSGQDGIDNGLTSKRAADVRAEALGPTDATYGEAAPDAPAPPGPPTPPPPPGPVVG